MDDTIELPYPEWQLSLQDAILEVDRDKSPEKTRRVAGLTLEGLLELQQSNSGHNERAAIIDGLFVYPKNDQVRQAESSDW
jgi:hypothetical protein